MAYAPPTVGPAGLTLPTYSDILADLLAQYRNVYGQSVYLGADSADYQWISILAAKMADTLQALLLTYNARSPVTASGAALDAIVKVNGLARLAASPSTCVVILTGAPGATITNGVIRDTAGYLWNLPAGVTIGAAGTALATAVCRSVGTVAPAVGDLSGIAAPQAGWLSVTNTVPAAVGLPVESDAQLRARQALSVATPSRTMLAGTIAAIAAVSGVTRYAVLENPTNAADANGLPAHSIRAVVEGGLDADIAQAVYGNRGIGCYTDGGTVVQVSDPYTGAVMPVRFARPAYVPIYVSIGVHPLWGYTTATAQAIQAAVAAYLAGLQIGQSVVLSELYGAALNARSNPDMPSFSIRSLTLGTSASPAGTADITLTGWQVAQGATAQVAVTLV